MAEKLNQLNQSPKTQNQNQGVKFSENPYENTKKKLGREDRN